MPPGDRLQLARRTEVETDYLNALFRVFVLKELHGWEYETTLVEYLDSHPTLCERSGFETIPDQSTLWRSWYNRFTDDLRETVQKVARTILIKAQNAEVAIPREPERNHPPRSDDTDDRVILNKAETITGYVSRVLFPAFSLNRGDVCEIHENAFWSLQTYLGLRENLAANEGARSFIYESTRERTPLGHAHIVSKRLRTSMGTECCNRLAEDTRNLFLQHQWL